MAKVKIIWTRAAHDDFEAIVKYIARDSLYYAALVGQQILLLVESLGIFPCSGRIVPEYKSKALREKIFQNYRIVYRKKRSLIEVIAIVHSARSIKDIL